MFDTNRELHEEASSQESKLEGLDQEKASDHQPDASKSEIGSVKKIRVEKQHRLNIQVKFCPSCQVNVAGRGLESLEFFPFKLPPLDRRKTDIRELQNAVTRYLVVGRLSGQCLVACLIQ